MSAHTPGPWRMCGQDRGGCICGIVWSESSDIPVADASLSGHDDLIDVRPSESERKANARLIAAAPDMAAMLIRIRDDRSWRTDDNALWPDLLALIAKATQP